MDPEARTQRWSEHRPSVSASLFTCATGRFVYLTIRVTGQDQGESPKVVYPLVSAKATMAWGCRQIQLLLMRNGPAIGED